MSVISEEYINTILNNVAVQCNLVEWRYSIKKFESTAQNYFGVLIPVVLIGKKDCKDINIRLVLKLAPTDERFRVSGALTLMFSREIFVYTTLLTKYQELQQNFSAICQYIIPKCYYICKEYCKEAIAMQDMCGENYKPYSHGMFLDIDHITLSLKSLAKLHALSFILKEKDTKTYENVVEICTPLTGKNKRFMEILIDRLTKASQKFETTTYVPLFEMLKENCVKFIESATDDATETCICHGDIWKENILFQYEDNKPISACLIDYQTARMCSPALDTLYLITTSTDSELRQKHFFQLLDTYYQTFEQTLNEAGLKSKVYSRQMLDEDLKIVGPACFIIANTALWLSNGLQEEGHVRSKHIWSTEQEKAEAVERYKSIIIGIINDLNSYGYLCLCR